MINDITIPPKALEAAKVAEGADEIERLTAEVERLRSALEPFAQMGKVMMGRRHHAEAVVQYSLAPTIKVHHLVAAYNALEKDTRG